jgi:CHAD domain-containing protein
MTNYKKQIEWNFNELKRHLNSYYETKDPEDLHKLRVRIKKIRALCEWSNSFKENSNKRPLIKLKKLFKEAGNIRSILITISTLNAYGIKTSQIIKEEQKKLKLNTRLFLIHFWLYKKDIDTTWLNIKDKIKEPKPKQVSNNALKSYKVIEDTLNNKKKKDEWHEARKLLKIVLYNAEVVNQRSNQIISFNFEYASNIQHQLGEWHDLTVTLSLLKMYFNGSNSKLKAIKTQIQDLEKNIELNATDLTKKIQNKTIA